MAGFTAILSLVSSLQSAIEVVPLPVDPPIGGFVWTVVVPAALFLGSFLGTYLLYKKFSKAEVGE